MATNLPGNGANSQREYQVLGDECLVNKDLNLALLGRVKEFTSLANIKVAFGSEGFTEIIIKYMGELWVMLEFLSMESLDKFRKNVSIASWVSQVINANIDFVPEGRIAWVEVEGVPFKLWSRNSFSRIAAKWGTLLDVDDRKDKCYHSKRICIYMKSDRSIKNEFNIIHRGKKYWIRANETVGWVPDFTDESADEEQDEFNYDNDGNDNGIPDEGLRNSKEDEEAQNSNTDKSDDPFNIYPLLNKGNISVGCENVSNSLEFLPGFTPATEKVEVNTKKVDANSNEKERMSLKCDKLWGSTRMDVYLIWERLLVLKEWKRCIDELFIHQHSRSCPKGQKNWVMELCIKNKVNFLAIQETKMETIDSVYVRQCWGNMAFDHAHSGSVGNSRGILCIWDTYSFIKQNVTVSDYFIIIGGTWRATSMRCLMIVVYAPQDSRDKIIL
nr:nucleotide-binding alpha-beta plait domain-containing protein [Tanacetum cinerariifolium]